MRQKIGAYEAVHNEWRVDVASELVKRIKCNPVVQFGATTEGAYSREQASLGHNWAGLRGYIGHYTIMQESRQHMSCRLATQGSTSNRGL